MAQSKGGSDIFAMPVGKVMSKEVKPLSRNDTVKDVLGRFRDGVDTIVIVDQDQLVCGIITPSDSSRVVDAFKKNKDTAVTDVMIHNPYRAYESEPIGDVLAMMHKMNFSGVPVVDKKSNKYLGIVRKSQIAQLVDGMIQGMKAS